MHNHGIGAWAATRRRKSPDKVAIVAGDVQVTYRQFAAQVDRISSVLRHRGLGRGDAVAYIGENCPEFLEVMFAAAQLGAVFVPVNTRLAPPEVAHVLADSGARVVIVDPAPPVRVDRRQSPTECAALPPAPPAAPDARSAPRRPERSGAPRSARSACGPA